MAKLYGVFIVEKEITERFVEIIEVDDMGKPSGIEPMDFGVQYFEDPTSIYLDDEVVGHNNHEMNALVWGMGEEVISDMDELQSFGYQLIGEKPPDNWTGRPVDYCRH